MSLTLGHLIIVSHLKPGTAEAALDIEALIRLAAVENGLVAAHLGGDVVERLDDAQPQLLTLLIFCDGDVLDVADRRERVDAMCRERSAALLRPSSSSSSSSPVGLPLQSESNHLQLALYDQGAGADDACGRRVGVLNNEDEIAALLPGHPVVAILELLLGNLAHRRQHPEAVEEARVVISPS